MLYTDCPILCNLEKDTVPLITKVKTDEFTEMTSSAFDYEFTGESVVYPYKMPTLPKDFGILCIVGASGSGKSTLARKFSESYAQEREWFKDHF